MDQKNYKKLFQDCNNVLDLKSLQFFMPLFSLYFYIHNTPCS